MPAKAEGNGNMRPLREVQSPFDNDFEGKHIISVDQFNKDDLAFLLMVADVMRRADEKEWHLKPLDNKSVTVLFYEPSSRTFGSFVSAANKLGAGVTQLSGVQYSSVSKGETLEDTVRTFGTQSDLIVMRHPEVGSAEKASKITYVPLINGGDGIGEHPTQALLDYYTIVRELGSVDGKHVVMVGDLMNGRTVHSLVKLLKMFDAKVSFVSPDSLRMPKELIEDAAKYGILGTQTKDLMEVLGDADVLYVTRVQKERFASEEEYDAVKDAYVVNPGLLKRAKKEMIVMHPLPRVNEIDIRVDTDRRAAYMRQMKNGLYIRMALLAAVLGKV